MMDKTTVIINIPAVDSWTLTDLRKCCKHNKVKGYTKMDREQLVAEVKRIISEVGTK